MLENTLLGDESMITVERKLTYAQVLLEIGVALKAGQPLLIEAPVGQEEFVSLVAQQAYAMKCPDVGILWRSDRVECARLAAGVSASAQGLCAFAEQYAQRGAAYLRLDSPDLQVFSSFSAQELSQKAVEDAKVRELFRKHAPGCGQTIACVPSQSWADVVFPELPPQQRLEQLWEAVLFCTRCKEKDPVAAWREYLAGTARKKQLLDQKGYTAFHYHDGCGTDLTICPAQGDNWKGSCIPSKDRISVPNIPTEEVFLTPHKYQVNGTVHSTMPLNYKGTLIDGIELEFQNGRIVRAGARQGEELLRAIIDTDEGSHHLGEMALVDQASGIASVGRVFYTTLYDENASCHLAIGNALGFVRDADERERRGMNTSKVHVDFMIGSDRLCIDGQLPDGSWESVFVDGHWAKTLK